jgi:hypothetical protein
LGGLLLGTAPTNATAGHLDTHSRHRTRHLELLRMSMPARRQQTVLRYGDMPRLEIFLQCGLGILSCFMRINLLDTLLIERRDHFLGSLETGIEISRTQDSLERICQYGWAAKPATFELSLTKTKYVTQLEFRGKFRKRFLSHQTSSQPRQLALSQVWEALIQQGRNRATQHTVPKKFETFVMRRRVTPMRQRLAQQLRLPENVT